MCNLRVRLGGKSVCCVCDHVCFHGQAGGHASADTAGFVYSSSTLIACEPLTRAVPRGCAVRADHDVMWFAVGFDH